MITLSININVDSFLISQYGKSYWEKALLDSNIICKKYLMSKNIVLNQEYSSYI